MDGMDAPPSRCLPALTPAHGRPSRFSTPGLSGKMQHISSMLSLVFLLVLANGIGMVVAE